jgi:hypothetical protein
MKGSLSEQHAIRSPWMIPLLIIFALFLFTLRTESNIDAFLPNDSIPLIAKLQYFQEAEHS